MIHGRIEKKLPRPQFLWSIVPKKLFQLMTMNNFREAVILLKKSINKILNAAQFKQRLN